MVNATVENTPITEAITSGNIIQVPNGEVWDVTITAEPSSSANKQYDSQVTDRTLVEINSVTIAGSKSQSDTNYGGYSGGSGDTVPFGAVLEGGTTIGAVGGNALVTGYKVQE